MSGLEINTLCQSISICMVKDRKSLREQLQSLCTNDVTRLEKLHHRILVSQALARQRQQATPVVKYDQSLPVVARKSEIADAIRDNQVVVIVGETGSGKTTQLPKICLEGGLGVYGQVGHTQPRRLAASSVAGRIAEELQVPLGEQVGYQIRFKDQSSDKTLIKLMTDGILLAEIQKDRLLSRYDTLIIDEAHERSLNIDFLLGYIKLILPKRPDLKVVITSATIDTECFSKHFDNAPVIEVSGRVYPVDVCYRPMEELELEGKDADQRLQQSILLSLKEINTLEHSGKGARLGDVLVFLSGEREIRETAKFLRDAGLTHTEVLPLYARLTLAEQNRIFQPHSGRRVILSTNVAETSLTLPSIRYVIDSGRARVSRYSVRSKVQRLPIESISQSSANQRKGRCGRVADGVCFRLFSEQDFLSRSAFTDAEILRTNLAAVVMQMLSLGLGDITDFPFVDKPEAKAINDGFKLLQELGAVDSKRRLTDIGRKMSKFPVDPRQGRMLIEGQKNNALRELLVIISALAVQDPRERPIANKQRADQCHREQYHNESDFMTFVNIWDSYEKQRQELSQSQLRQYCKQQFLSFVRMREWRDLHRQLLVVCHGLKYRVNGDPASYSDIHKALLSGLLSHIGSKGDDADYIGARNQRFFLFPASTLSKRKPKWVVTAELVETSRLFGRINAKIEPEWIEPLARELVKRTYLEPHWEKKWAQVIAFEQVTLYGLIIIGRRRINYGAIDLEVSREIFIREALVEGHYESKGAFQTHNNALLAEIDQLESKSRRRDILVDSATLYSFYAERVPLGIVNGAGFEKWRKEVEYKKAQWLMLTRDYLMKHDAGLVTEASYPDRFCWEGLELPLSYHFVPGDSNDGVTLTIPVQALAVLPKYRLEWLVPGMLFEKCVALVRALPKILRKNFVPVPDFVRGALEAISTCDEPLTKMLSKELSRMSGVMISDDVWCVEALDVHFFMNINVTDEDGQLLGNGRNLIELKEKFEKQAQAGICDFSSNDMEQEGLKDWSCGDLPLEVTQKCFGLILKMYPALVDQRSSVSVALFESAALAEKEHRLGLVRLLRFRLESQLKFIISKMPHLKETKLLSVNFVNHKVFDDEIQDFLVLQALLQSDRGRPSSREVFDQLVEDVKETLLSLAEEVDILLNDIFRVAQPIFCKLKDKRIPFDRVFSMADIKWHLNHLLGKGFLQKAGMEWLSHYPRYMKAVALRLEKLPMQVNKDRAWAEELSGLQKVYYARAEIHTKHKIVDENLSLYSWMIEEYRVSLFAQHLGTRFPVSDKRLRKLWAEVRNA
ncbi:MAG: ATP-dependent RNA helicase HrpA [Candidatus Endonucleobacter sp. (ex Gigantidas childressi)]|nr:ATP-dependent RNA helicase HrpA [Candidatus Endonucleobacter sp. (ex Gigantidas childressi)]